VALEKKQQAEKLQAEKIAAEKKAAELKAEKEQEAQEQLEAAAAVKARDDQMRRIMGQAGATGGPQATGSVQKASGPSPGYNSRLVARIRPNVVFADAISGNPVAEIEVRTQPDGTITSRRLVKSSGNPAWDEAALRAIDRTGSLPRDTDGKVPSPMIVVLRPQD
jgi:colicin import membrane protein